MKPFAYTRAESVGAALEALRAAGMSGDGGAARFLGGGTNLVDLMKLEIETPDALVDVSRIETDAIEESEVGLLVGAAVTNSALAAHPLVRQRYPLLSTALLSGASPQLRNKATTGGNLLQRTRCQYFYDTDRACNKRAPGAGCDALEGHNRFHAILGASEDCIAVHPSDMAVAMVTLDAVVHSEGATAGARRIPLRKLHRLPGDTPHIEHVLEPGELIVRIALPADPPARQAYRKVRDRSSYAFAVVSAGVAFDLEAGRLANTRIGLGGVAHKPWRAERAEAALNGEEPSLELFRDAAGAEMAEARGRGGNDFKIDLAARLIVSMLRELTTARDQEAA